LRSITGDLFTGIVIFVVAMASHPATWAAEFSLFGNAFDGTFDTTVTVGASMRAEGRSSRHIGVANGGSGFSVNGDDGNLNYDPKDIFSGIAKVTHELEISGEQLGLFARGFYYYDVAVKDGHTRRTRLESEAKRISGFDGEILDLYVTADGDISDMPVVIRAGQQVISLGESTFIQNGINTINPVDVSKLRVAGAELRDALIPLPMISASVGLSERFSVEPFYMFYFDHTEIEPRGTFFSTNDFAGPDGDYVYLGFGLAPDTPPGSGFNGVNAVGRAVPRASDDDAPDQGQWGIALRYYEPELNDTEFGFYFTRLHSRLPLISASTGTVAGVGALDYAGSASYQREFPDYINSYAVSFNTTIPTGIAWQGEVTYREDQPLQIDDAELLLAALSPLNPGVFGLSQLGAFGFGTDIRGYKEKDVVQAQSTLSQIFGPRLGADQYAVVAETGGTWIRNMESKGTLRYEAAGTPTSGNPTFTALAVQPGTTSSRGFPDDFSWGYRLLARATYSNVIGSVNMIPQIAFAHDVQGTTPAPVANFIQNRKTVTLSCKATYLNAWEGVLAYTNFYGADSFNPLADRDFVSLTASYSF